MLILITDLDRSDETTIQNIPMAFSDDASPSHNDQMDESTIRPQQGMENPSPEASGMGDHSMDIPPETAESSSNILLQADESLLNAGNTNAQHHDTTLPSPGASVDNDDNDSDIESSSYSYSDSTTTTSHNEDTTDPLIRPAPPRPKPTNPHRVLKTSRYGVPYPSLPAGMVKRIATTLTTNPRRGSGIGGSGGSNSATKAAISKDTLNALIEASDCFFEQVGDDLGVYARHAGRKTIDESDMITLMKRYVITNFIIQHM